jgi:hypothetical protein
MLIKELVSMQHQVNMSTTIFIPVAASPSASNSDTFLITLTKAVPPPDTIPSSTAARVEFKASYF